MSDDAAGPRGDGHPSVTTGPVRGTAAMIAGMRPRRNPGAWRFASVEGPAPEQLAAFREAEGWSAILPAAADETGAMAWISLDVHSALDGVGLTAAVSATLAAAGIACNVVAALRHDHLFVPVADADRAVALLQERSRA